MLKKTLFGFYAFICFGLTCAGVSDFFSNLPKNPKSAVIDVFIIIVFLLLGILCLRKMGQGGTSRKLNLVGFFDIFKKKSDPPLTQNRGPSPSVEALFETRVERHDPEENLKAPKGAEISYLDAEALRFWNKKQTDFIIPPYYSESAFGRNVGPALKRLIQGGYLERSGIEKSISIKTVPELKAILAEHELKVSGKKAELVYRLMDNLSESELEELFPVGVYSITQKGMDALEPYSIIEASEAHSLGFSYYRLLNEKERHPNDSNETILSKMLISDIQECYKTGDQARYQEIIARYARFMSEIGESERALESYILSFFMYSMQVKKYPELNRGGQSFYLASQLEQCAQNEGCSLDQLVSAMTAALEKNHPFQLTSRENIRFCISLFKKSLSMRIKG